MKAGDRKRLLMQALASRQHVSLQEGIQLLGASESTVRRLFVALEQEGTAVRTHGGIELRSVDPQRDYSFELLAQSSASAKQVIAEAALNLVEPGDTVFLDSGTTVRTFALCLARDPRLAHRGITFFTNSFANVEVLTGLAPTVMTGGEYRSNRRDFAGYIAEDVLSGLNFRKAFLGADGIFGDSLQATDFETARLSQIVVRNSEETILLCDSTKFNKRSLVSYARFNEVDTLITDNGIGSDDAEHVERSGLRLIIADETVRSPRRQEAL